MSQTKDDDSKPGSTVPINVGHALITNLLNIKPDCVMNDITGPMTKESNMLVKQDEKKLPCVDDKLLR